MYAPSSPETKNVSLTFDNVVDFQFFKNGATPNNAAVLTKGRADDLYAPAGDYATVGDLAELDATWVMDQVAAVGAGTKGTYVFAYKTDDTASNYGEIVAGSALTVAGVAEAGVVVAAHVVGGAVALGGSWQAHGFASFGGGSSMATLFRRKV
jgi:hypothetical protein